MQLNQIGTNPDHAEAARVAHNVLSNLKEGPFLRRRLYQKLVLAREIAAADLVVQTILPARSVETGPLWRWRLLQFAMMADAQLVRDWLKTRPEDDVIPFSDWWRIVMECESHQLECGTLLRALFAPGLSPEISAPDLLTLPFDPPLVFQEKRLEKITRMRKSLGLACPDSFLKDCKRATFLNALLFTYGLNGLGPGGRGRDNLLPIVTIKDNAEWSACLANGRPFVLACFHAGPIVDASWPARSAKVPLFHVGRRQGSRAGSNFVATEHMTTAEFSDMIRNIIKAPAGLIVAADIGKGVRDTGQTLCGENLWLLPFPAYIAHRTQSEVFFMHSKWTDTGISIEIVTGPRAMAAQSRDAWERDFNTAYADQLKAIISGDGLNNLR
ncbi:MAG: hypothetical protein ACRCS3_05620 [Paracoccaceae bacterium]